MIEVPVTEKWFATESTLGFLEWVDQNKIAEGDWNFKTTAGVLAPTFLFRHEDDVIAFKLRFGQ